MKAKNPPYGTDPKVRAVRVGRLTIGGGAPVVVQSMCSTDTRDTAATLAQIHRLAVAGCELVRVAVPDESAASTLSDIVNEADMPVVADIHFHYKLALQAIRAGVAKVRINPGNIGTCLLYTSPSPRDLSTSRMPSSA